MFLDHLYTLFLFTYSDQKTILFPETIFGLVTSLGGNVLFHQPIPKPSDVLRRSPLVLGWVYINLLPFNINNQLQPSGLREDAINKPWRPLPAGRISDSTAKRHMLIFYATAVAASTVLGCLAPCISLLVLGYVYNELGGSDRGPWIRNFINGAGFTSFAAGATTVAIGGAHLNYRAYQWFIMIFWVVCTTVQIQDLPDQEGDRARNRRTVPIVLGDGWSRWTITFPVLLWSLATPAFWGLSVVGALVPTLIGIVVAVRVICFRRTGDDRVTFILWNIWMVSTYLLPLIKLFGSTGSKYA
ncbi:MAG: hypothetical protein M1820_000641 [Bogoriella megaspora]|nr:MAG: hypothetical protein M1820_000641 [Bogoriella megaspora]